jgi:hypothetical protein
MLDYKTIMGDILVFKDKSTMTIMRGDGFPYVNRIEVDGEDIDVFDPEAKHPFTEEEIEYFTDERRYSEIVGPNY